MAQRISEESGGSDRRDSSAPGTRVREVQKVINDTAAIWRRMTKTETMRIQVVGAKTRLPRASTVCHKVDDVLASKRTRNKETTANLVAQLNDHSHQQPQGTEGKGAGYIVEWQGSFKRNYVGSEIGTCKLKLRIDSELTARRSATIFCCANGQQRHMTSR